MTCLFLQINVLPRHLYRNITCSFKKNATLGKSVYDVSFLQINMLPRQVVAAPVDDVMPDTGTSCTAAQRRALLLLAHQQQRSSADTEGLAEEEDEPTLRAELPPQPPVCM
jgi:hypothetical protein